jgi:hypothetical protein
MKVCAVGAELFDADGAADMTKLIVAFLKDVWRYLVHDHSFHGARGGAAGLGTALQAGRFRVRFPMVSLEFFIGIILPAALLPSDQLTL